MKSVEFTHTTPRRPLFIADYLNNRIRKVSTNAIITTFAGNGAAGFFGDGGAATSANIQLPTSVDADAVGNLYIADSGNVRIRKVAANGTISTVAGSGSFIYSGDDGFATNAGLSPASVATDASGNLFIADAGNNRIREVLAREDIFNDGFE